MSPHLWVQNVVVQLSSTIWNCPQANLLPKLSEKSRKINKSILLDCPMEESPTVVPKGNRLEKNYNSMNIISVILICNAFFIHF